MHTVQIRKLVAFELLEILKASLVPVRLIESASNSHIDRKLTPQSNSRNLKINGLLNSKRSFCGYPIFLRPVLVHGSLEGAST